MSDLKFYNLSVEETKKNLKTNLEKGLTNDEVLVYIKLSKIFRKDKLNMVSMN